LFLKLLVETCDRLFLLALLLPGNDGVDERLEVYLRCSNATEATLGW
jgi:hypothetical protein